MKSAKSIKSTVQDSLSEEKAMEIEEYIMNACVKFNCPHQVKVVKETQRDMFYGNLKKSGPLVKYKKITVAPSHPLQVLHDSELGLTGPSPNASNEEIDKDAVLVKALYDNMNHLVELSLTNVKDIPRVLMQVLVILAPYLMQLNKISITRSTIDKYTIYELNKMISLSNITEVCLDDSALPEANYAILLDGPSSLRSLSLSRCCINDAVCKQIVGRLHYLEPSEPIMGVLNLSSNQITDEGAKCIGEALRTNRHLRYLNLADNRITDEGAGHILNVLGEFPLTVDEVSEKRHRLSDYVRKKQAMFAKCLNEFDSKSVDEYSKRPATKKKGKPVAPLKNKPRANSFSDDYLNTRAATMTEELIGPYNDPFGPGYAKLKNDYSHCIGNFIVCYLNLSYNHLTYVSVRKLLDVVRYQQLNKIRPGEGGLMKVVIDGNYMPETCSEMTTLNSILQNNISCFGSRACTAPNSRRKSARMSMAVTSGKSVAQ